MPSRSKKKARSSADEANERQSPLSETCELCSNGDRRNVGAVHYTRACGHARETPLQAHLDITNALSFHRRGHLINSFHLRCSQVYAHIHRICQGDRTVATWSPDTIHCLGEQLLSLFPEFTKRLVCESNTNASAKSPTKKTRHSKHEPNITDDSMHTACPFVMLISILLPTLRKFLEWTTRTRSMWGSQHPADSSSGDGDGDPGPIARPVSTLMELYQLLTQLTYHCDEISCVIETNEELQLPRDGDPQLASPKTSGFFVRAPQIKRISAEFEQVHAEYKVQLAELTEAIFEVVEMVAARHCRPASSKTRPASAVDFVEVLIHEILSPVLDHVQRLPSIHSVEFLRRVLDKCVCVAIDELVVDNVKMNEILVAQFEKATARLKVWCTQSETELKLALAPRECRSENSGDTSDDTASPAFAGPELQLLELDSIRRLDGILHGWLRASKADESILQRMRKANLDSLRSSLTRSRTMRGNVVAVSNTARSASIAPATTAPKLKPPATVTAPSIAPAPST